MKYCILRTEKIKTYAELTRKFEHNYRIIEIPNAAPQLQEQNEELVPLLDKNGNPCNLLQAYYEKISSLDYYKTHKVMKGSVIAVEVVTTFSREARAQIDIEEWKAANVKWIREFFNKDINKFGDNLISVVFHDDENGNAHCHAIVIPIDEVGKLSCSKYLDGRALMHGMQDSYAKAMSPLGLKRGLKGSTARHEDIGKFYAKVNEKMEFPKPEKEESANAYYHRITATVQTERATGLRQILELDRSLREKRDKKFLQDMAAIKETALAEKAALQSQIADMERILSSGQKKLNQIYEEIEEQNIIKENQIYSYDKAIADKTEEIAEMNERAREIHKKIGRLELAKDDLMTYRTQLAAMEYARKVIPMIAEEIDNDMEIALQFYEEHEWDIER